MAKVDLSFNFGANVKPRKARKKAKGKGGSTGHGRWAAYVSGKKR
jgi:hypothetical protein